MKNLSTYLIGLLFGLGISISGMANPAKVLNFFDLAGSWDPSLMFVMGGAQAVAIPGYRLVVRRASPLMAPKFSLPAKKDIDRERVGGAARFGVGWGIAGFCPGGALPVLGTGRTEVFIFVAALCAGLLLARVLKGMTPTPKPQSN